MRLGDYNIRLDTYEYLLYRGEADIRRSSKRVVRLNSPNAQVISSLGGDDVEVVTGYSISIRGGDSGFILPGESCFVLV